MKTLICIGLGNTVISTRFVPKLMGLPRPAGSQSQVTVWPLPEDAQRLVLGLDRGPVRRPRLP